MKHRLIIVDGQSTVGKSTISKSVFKQIVNQDQVYWLHEECENHPIRQNEFEIGNIHTLDGMELNRKDMLQKWHLFSKQIMESGQTCVTEGCLLHAMDRYLIESSWNEKEISNYFEEIIEIIKPLNPLIVFLHRPNLKLSFEKAFKARGDWWKDIILRKPDDRGYFKTNKYTGDDSIFDCKVYEQHQMDNIFEVLQCDKLKLDTTEEQWESYVRQITESAGYIYQNHVDELPELGEYCGTYRIQGGEDTWSICYNDKSNEVYTSLFWPYMPMKYIGNNEFELISFPITLTFKSTTGKVKFTVNGNYDWGYNGKVFIKS